MNRFFDSVREKWKGSGLHTGLDKVRTATDRAEDSVLAFAYRWRFALFIVAVTVLAVVGRIPFWPFASGDYNGFLHHWLNEIREAHGFHSIGIQIGNYTAPYHYLMAVMTYIPGLSNLDVIKITSIFADFCMASAAAALCWQLTKSKFKACACYALVLCLPTVFFNSAAWGQCDAMYTCFILLFLTAYLREKRTAALFLFGIAQAIKLQAIFVLPAIIIFWICGRVRFRQLLAAVLGYVVMFVPAMVGAGSLEPLYAAYAMQTKVEAIASNIFNGASLFIGIDEEFLGYLKLMLIVATFIVIGTIAMFCWKNKSRMTAQSEFILVALMAVLVPFLLPAMKDRYYYMIEVLTVVYALVWPKRLPAPLLIQFASLPCYMYYLVLAANPYGFWPVLFVAAVIVMLLQDLFRLLSATASLSAKAPLARVE